MTLLKGSKLQLLVVVKFQKTFLTKNKTAIKNFYASKQLPEYFSKLNRQLTFRAIRSRL